MLRRLSRHLILIGAVAFATALTDAQPPPPAGYDVIIRGGTVIDGSGQPRYTADVGIVRGSIARVGALAGQTAATVIDATGLYVTPGFINIHSHATAEGLQRAQNMLAQGVTTEIVNADGSGPTELDPQLHRLRIAGLAVNVGANIGFNAIWAEVMGLSAAASSRGPTGYRPASITNRATTPPPRKWAGLSTSPAHGGRTSRITIG
jgi:N-acyl-D-amino-acid deacylase